MAVFTGTGRNERINGTRGDDEIFGLGGNDALNGGRGDDTLDGGEGADRLNGGRGDDTLIFDLADNEGNRRLERLDGGEGEDTLVLRVTDVMFEGMDEDDLDGLQAALDATRANSIRNKAFVEDKLGFSVVNVENLEIEVIDTTPPEVEDVSRTINEDRTNNLTGTFEFEDADPDSVVFSFSGGDQFGSLRINQNLDRYIYDLDEESDAVQSLAQGQSVVETYEVTATDGSGNSSTSTLEITIEGRNDAPVITEEFLAQRFIGFTEDAPGDPFVRFRPVAEDNTTPLPIATDIDDGDTLTYEITNQTRKNLGTAEIQGETIFYTLNNDGNAVQRLDDGETRQSVVEITVTDSFGETAVAELVINVTGVSEPDDLVA